MKKIKEILNNTIIYSGWLAFDGFLFQLLDTHTDYKNYRFLSILFRLYWRNTSLLFTLQTYLFDIYFKITKYDNIRVHLSIEILKWKKDFILWREDEENKPSH